jgi:hypothetical protein
MFFPRGVNGYAWRALERWRRRSSLQTAGFAHGRLIVSLTSYPARFPTLHLTLRCLLTQAMKADAVVLWIADSDIALLPDNVRQLTGAGLVIESCRDLRSYKKIVPALGRHAGDFIATADDDVYYDEAWLRDLAALHEAGRRDVICHRAHEIRHGAAGRPLPYVLWKLNTRATNSEHLFSTGCGGVLYPPGSLHRDTLDVEAFSRLCPTGDDIWLYWMTKRAGSAVRRVPERRALCLWPGSQARALRYDNVVNGANSRQVRAMIESYGYPP